ncbi:protein MICRORCHIDIA 6-like isoform X2 [Ananas comosus]|uniref:Protein MICRORCHIDIA 6-like isoform X2 n=1 Tax=Ananas comosus TaxID=4615 RepID=A0A6P5FTR1_ANACO|nr:protein MICRORCHIDIA 6-like isoform X2 [Ananas comosus]
MLSDDNALGMSFECFVDLCSDEETENTELTTCKETRLVQEKARSNDNLKFGSSKGVIPSSSWLMDQESLSGNEFHDLPTLLNSIPFCRQFWKAGDYTTRSNSVPVSQNGKNRLRIHPKFLHSNATSQKWAFGAIAELLDNAVDEVQNGATFVKVDRITNSRDGNDALLVQDDGGGMGPESLRRCMSFGFSDKHSDSFIGQYGNGFKTSTMRLGADVIVFSRRMNNRTLTQSVGLLSYTFLQKAGYDDVIVPVFDNIGHHGTKIIVFNLWFNDSGKMELDFISDLEDIMITGAPCGRANMLSEKHIANRYRYSLRVYASILYLHLPQSFRIVLRGRDVTPHHIVDDLKFRECIKYRPQILGSKEAEVITTIGFLDGAPKLSVHGFNVYHRNRLILPFWRVFVFTRKRGRGIAGVLEANFIKPTHNKQDFEKSTLYHKLEIRLRDMTAEYWKYHCHLVGYSSPVTGASPKRPQIGTANELQDASSNHCTPANLSNGLSSSSTVITTLNGQPNLMAMQVSNSCKADSQAAFHGKRSANHVITAEVPKRQAVAFELTSGVGGNLKIQHSSDGQRQMQEIITMMHVNKKLRERCLEYEIAQKQLLLKVEMLKNELQEVQWTYKILMGDLLKV